jgi:hypothetical protein
MPLIPRRRFLASSLTAPLGASAFSPPFADAAVRRRAFLQYDVGLSAGCVLAWERQDRCDGLIDFWTARVSDIDPTTFSSCVQRVVLWDDVFSLRTVQKRVDEINSAIRGHFGFDCRLAPSGFALHLDGLNTVDQMLARRFEAKDRDSKRTRTALIDLDSCGVTALDWPQILPSLRGQYDLIIGVARATHLCTNPEKLRPIGSGNSFVYESTWINLQKCDFSFVCSDILLSGNSERNLEERDHSPSDLIGSLTSWLRNERLVRRLSMRNVGERAFSPMFGISGCSTRISDKDHFNEISTRQNDQEKLFGSLSKEQAVLMLDAGNETETIGTIALWPIAILKDLSIPLTNTAVEKQ